MVGSQEKVVLFAFLQEHRNVRDLKCMLDQRTYFGKQLFKVKHCGRLLGNGVDSLQLQGPSPFQRVQACVLQRHRSLSREKRQQINGFLVEMVDILALAVQHAHNLIAHH